MKKIIVLISALAIAISLSACGKEKTTSIESAKDDDTANSVSQTVPKTSEAVQSTNNEILAEKTYAKTSVDAESTKSNENKTVPTVVHPTVPKGTTVDTFVITKVSGTYLELQKVIYGKDTEKLVYCCDLGNFDGSADMRYKAGDDITLRYDSDVAETYPLQLTVREIL